MLLKSAASLARAPSVLNITAMAAKDDANMLDRFDSIDTLMVELHSIMHGLADGSIEW
jgi:hypothetical protein